MSITKEKFGKALYSWRKSLDLNQAEAASRLRSAGFELSNRTYQNWETGSTAPHIDIISRIVSDVIGHTEQLTDGTRNGSRLSADEDGIRNSTAHSKLVYLPLASVTASGGDGSEVFENEIEAFVGYDATQLRRELGINPASLVIILVTGNSMEPTATPGDRLWVLKYDGEPVLDGAIYVFRREYAGIIVKRVYWNQDGSLFLRGDNPDGGPDMTIKPGDEAEWRVVGRVLRVEKNL